MNKLFKALLVVLVAMLALTPSMTYAETTVTAEETVSENVPSALETAEEFKIGNLEDRLSLFGNGNSIFTGPEESVSTTGNANKYSSSPAIIDALNKIFAGELGLTKNGKKVLAPLGSQVMKNHGDKRFGEKYRYNIGDEGKTTSGSSCWAGANGAYGVFMGSFSEMPINGGSYGPNSESLKLSGTKKVTYDNFVKWRVRKAPGAYIRVGTHSIFLLNYTKDYIEFIDWNGDGNGLAAIRKESWKSLDSNLKNKTVHHIIQPKDAFYNQLTGNKTVLASGARLSPGTLRLGKPYTLKGTIVGGKNRISTVLIAVLDQKNNIVVSAVRRNVNAYTFDIARIDAEVKFNKIKNAGTYRLVVAVSPLYSIGIGSILCTTIVANNTFKVVK